MTASDGLRESYLTLLGGDGDIGDPYQWGRAALDKGATLLDVVAVHSLSLADQLVPHRSETSMASVDRAVEVMKEALGPYEMAYRGFREANDTLRTSNRRLEDTAHELAEVTAFLEHAIDLSPIVFVRYAPVIAEITYISPSFTRLLGYPIETAGRPTEFATKPSSLLGLTHEEDRRRLGTLVASVLHRGRAGSGEFRFRAADGTNKWFDLALRFDPGADGAPGSLICHGLDITDRKATEIDLDRARLEAEQANQAKSDFLSRMSHELRTPLNSVIGFAQLLELGDLIEDDAESVAMVLKGGRHLLELINEVLDLARIESGNMTISMEPVRMDEVFSEVMQLMKPMAVDAGIELKVEPGSDQILVLADYQRIKQVMINLLSNAVKYTSTAGSVTISCQLEGGQVRVSVADDGPGISAYRIERLFIPFDRLGAEGGEVEGTGLGLALSKGLVEAMDGQLTVESQVGAGSVFHVTLQSVDAASLEIDMLADLGSAAPLPEESRQATILYIEDNPANVALVRRVLKFRPNIRTLVSINGISGIDMAKTHIPDLILLDLDLPDIHGHEVLRHLKGDESTADIPVVIVSADATHSQVKRLLDDGAHAYLTKPIDVSELLAAVDLHTQVSVS